MNAPGLLSRNSRMSDPAMRKILPSLRAQNVRLCGLRCSSEYTSTSNAPALN